MRNIFKFVLSLLFVMLIIACTPSIDESNTFIVTFDTNGGIPFLIEPQQIVEGGLINQPVDPFKNDYLFVHWFNEDLDREWRFNVDLVNKNILLTAIYEEVELEEPEPVINYYYVTFNYNTNNIENEVVRVEENELITPPLEPLREGHYFIGWYLNEELFDFNEVIKEDITLIAKYQINSYEVVFDFNNDNYSEDLIKTVLHNHLVGAPIEPELILHEFIGWFDAEDNLYNFNEPVIKDIILTAKYERSYNDYEKVEVDLDYLKDELTKEYIVDNYELPTIGRYGSLLSWETVLEDNSKYLNNNTLIHHGTGINSLDLKLTTTAGNESMTTSFTINIISKDYYNITTDLNLLELEFSNDIIKDGLILPIVGANSSTITWIPDDNSYLDGNKIVYNNDLDNIVILEATITSGDEIATIEFIFQILSIREFNLNKDLSLIPLTKTYHENLILPTIGEYGSIIEWTLYSERQPIDNTLLLPQYGEFLYEGMFTITNGDFNDFKEFKYLLSPNYKLELPNYVTSNLTNLDEVAFGTHVFLEVNTPSNNILELFKVNNVVVSSTTYNFIMKQDVVVTTIFRNISTNEITHYENFNTLKNYKESSKENWSSYEDFYYYGYNNFMFDIINGRIDLGMNANDQGITIGGFGNEETESGMGWLKLPDFNEGLSSLEFTARLPFSPNSTYPQRDGKDTALNTKIMIYVNNDLIETLQFQSNSSANKGETFKISGLNYIGNVSFRIEISSGHRLTIGELRWTTNNDGVIPDVREDIVNIDFENSKFLFDQTSNTHSFNNIDFMLKEVHTDSMHDEKELPYMTDANGLVVSRFRGASPHTSSTPTAYIYNINPFDYVSTLSFDAKQFGSNGFFAEDALIKIYIGSHLDSLELFDVITDLKKENYEHYQIDIDLDNVIIKIEVINGTLNLDNIKFSK